MHILAVAEPIHNQQIVRIAGKIYLCSVAAWFAGFILELILENAIDVILRSKENSMRQLYLSLTSLSHGVQDAKLCFFSHCQRAFWSDAVSNSIEILRPICLYIPFISLLLPFCLSPPLSSSYLQNTATNLIAQTKNRSRSP